MKKFVLMFLFIVLVQGQNVAAMSQNAANLSVFLTNVFPTLTLPEEVKKSVENFADSIITGKISMSFLELPGLEASFIIVDNDPTVIMNPSRLQQALKGGENAGIFCIALAHEFGHYNQFLSGRYPKGLFENRPKNSKWKESFFDVEREMNTLTCDWLKEVSEQLEYPACTKGVFDEEKFLAVTEIYWRKIVEKPSE